MDLKLLESLAPPLLPYPIPIFQDKYSSSQILIDILYNLVGNHDFCNPASPVLKLHDRAVPKPARLEASSQAKQFAWSCEMMSHWQLEYKFGPVVV